MIPNNGMLAFSILLCIVSHIFSGEHKGWVVWLVQSWVLRRGLNTDFGMWVEFRTIAAPGHISIPLSSLPPQLSSLFTLHPQTFAPSISISSCSTLRAQMMVSWHRNGATGEEAAYTPRIGDKPCQTSVSDATLGHYIWHGSRCKVLFLALNWYITALIGSRIKLWPLR